MKSGLHVYEKTFSNGAISTASQDFLLDGCFKMDLALKPRQKSAFWADACLGLSDVGTLVVDTWLSFRSKVRKELPHRWSSDSAGMSTHWLVERT